MDNLRGARKAAKPCRKCGCEERYVVSGHCPICNTDGLLAWRSDNPDKVKAAVKRGHRKNMDKKLYGACVDNKKTATRRAIEERRELQELGLNG